MRVPTSLSAALEALRDETEDVLVWADSMCINQRSNRDKTQQLPLIPEIYSKAEQVVVWLGVEKDDSEQAQELLHSLVTDEVQLSPLLDLGSVVSLFDREFWSRLWVVQEVLHAQEIVVLCGSSRLPWDDYVRASMIFQSPDSVDKIRFFNERSGNTRLVTSQHRLNPSQILIHHGPASILHIQRARELAREENRVDDLHYTLHLMRLSRTKLASDPKDRVYGILGVLPRGLSPEIRVNYNLTVKEIYVDFVEWWMKASGSLNIICDSIHFPPQISNANLPSWVPDWSYDPTTQSLASLPLKFSASGESSSEYYFPDREDGRGPRLRNKLAIAGVRIGEISDHGTAVNTHCRAADYCMTFLQWRALLLQHFDIDAGSESHSEDRRRRVALCEHQRSFCLTLSLGQPVGTDRAKKDSKFLDSEKSWVEKCYSVFATVIKARLPRLPIDEDLMAFEEAGDDIKPDSPRQFLQDNFAEYMMGRCFCITDSGSLGLGSGAMARGDVVVVPYGCSTPVLLRPEGFGAPDADGQRVQEYRFVGDAYIDGHMYGEAMEHGSREEFILH
ncbi:hypothetical protein Daus18300_011260 [Diaporthe australafricana]|uniref:Heterokaryon incompatibility domain-containing protein n=1 Tax=Diaporthe australafricana TaxID=127596 RepID=A0ABR3W7I8_9PEZI